VRSAQLLFDRLEEVFRYIEPTEKNMGAFGPELRHLLILAATEVESGLKGVLRANGYARPSRDGRPPRGGEEHWTAADYRKLSRPMLLHRWSVELPMHPEVSSFRPFGNWSSASKPLRWWAAYNAVKHDREGQLKEATLRHVIHAMGAAYVMVVAQFGGWRRQYGYSVESEGFLFPDGPRAFAISSLFSWPPHEEYAPPPANRPWRERPYSFRRS